MATKTPETKEEQDSAYSPEELHKAENSSYVGAGTDQAEAFANDSANATKEKEENPDNTNNLNYTGGESNNQKTTSTFRGTLKKKGPIGGIIALLLGGGFGISMLFSPGIALVHLKEIMTEDLNDQLAAMDIRSTQVFKAKLKDIGKGVCTGVKVNCGFKGMSDKQVKKFTAAGIDVETGDKTTFGKNQVKSLTFKDSAGKDIKVTNVKLLNKHLGDRVVREQLRKAFNPKYAGFYDAVSTKVFTKFKTNKANKLKGKTTTELDKSVDDSVAGRAGSLLDAPKASTAGLTQAEIDAAVKNELDQQDRVKTGTGGVGGVFSGAVKGVGILGALDSACTVKNTARGVAAAAKVIRASQLVGFAIVFLNFADQVKAGTATPEQAEYVGNKLTAVDTDEMTITEDSPMKDGIPQEVKNPNFGKSAFDSAGYKVAAFNDAPNLSARSLQFTVGGGLVGNLASVNKKIANIKGIENCKLVQNPATRIVGGGIGLVAGFFTGGVSIAASIATSAGIALALPILESYLSDMIAGKTVGKTTKGTDAGDAVFAGTAKLQGDVAAGRGMKPLNKSEIKDYLAVSNNIKAEYIAMETEDAKNTPFDVDNQYSLLGSIARKVIPATSTASGDLSSKIATIPSLVSVAATGLTPSAKAVGVFNEERFEKCDDDEGYKDLGIDADVFCNVRYGLTDKELAMDTDAVIDFMFKNGYVDENGIPQAEYAEWLQECTQRVSGWGESEVGVEDGKTGAQCVGIDTPLTEEILSNFRVYTMDNSIIESMEYEGPTAATGPGIDVMSYNILGASQGSGNNNDGNIPWKTRADSAIATVNERAPSIIGFQELNSNQFSYIKGKLSTYQSTPESGSGNGYQRAIFWNSSLFTMVEQGTYSYTKNGNNSTYPWVKLSSAAGGGSVYVFNHHNTAHSGGGAKERQASVNSLLAAVGQTVKDGSPVVLVGDYNSTTKLRSKDSGISQNDLPYYILQGAGFTSSFDIATTKVNEQYNTSHGDAGAKRKTGSTKIDYVFVSTGIGVNSWETIISENTRIGSDHTPVIANLTIPGMTAVSGGDIINGPSKDGWVWPVPSTKSLGVLAYGGSGRRGQHKGIDIGKFGGSSYGTPVVAAHDGTVNRVWGSGDACGSYVSIAATGTSFYAAYQHLKDGSITVKAGQSVKAGQVIGVIGKQGGSTCGSAGFYHLHFSIESKPGIVSEYANAFPNGTVDPLKVLPR